MLQWFQDFEIEDVRLLGGRQAIIELFIFQITQRVSRIFNFQLVDRGPALPAPNV